MKLALLFVTVTQCVQITREDAHGFLQRGRRASDTGILGIEEFLEGSMERECIEESCSQEELDESLDIYSDKVAKEYNLIYHACVELSNIIIASADALKEGYNFDKTDLIRKCVHSEV